MKTATVTWITYHNYGTVLQAFALQKSIEQLGHVNEILSDREILRIFRKEHPFPHSTERAALRNVEAGTAGRLKRVINDPRRVLRALNARLNQEQFGRPYEGSQQAITAFIEQEMVCREKVFPNRLEELNEDYDAFLCGSDQIWSVFPENFEPYYFLSFAKKPKIAYAPSLGTDKIPSEISHQLPILLSDFLTLSVRERCSSEQLTQMLGRNVQWVADPTLLHDRAFWTAFCESVASQPQPYLLCYFLEDKPWYFSYAKQLAKQLHLRLLLLPNRWEYLLRGCIDTGVIGPREFVAKIRDADYVLTDSYHGTIFSLLFEKSFQYLQRFAEDDSRSQNIRIESLFELLGLRERIVLPEREKNPPLKIQNYQEINDIIRIFRDQSLRFLDQSFSCAEEVVYD